jgi:hypothetical protein
MSSSPVLDDAAFEAELRAMLARRAADLRPTRLTAPAARPVPPRARGRGWVVLAAAAAVVVVAGAAVALAGGDGDGDRTTTGPSSPGNEGAVEDATVIWPVVGEAALVDLLRAPGYPLADLVAPDTAAAAYLAEVAPGATPGEVAYDGGDRATVTWSSGNAYRGHVDLRDTGSGDEPLWVVTSTSTDGLDVVDVRAEDGGLYFRVQRTLDLGGADLSIGAGVGGEPASLTAPPAEGVGALLFFVPAPGGSDVDVLVRPGGEPYAAVTHVGFHLPDGAPAAPEPDVTPPPTDAPPTHGIAPSEPVLTGTGTPDATSGSYEGSETFVRATGGGCDLDHVLDLTLTPAGGAPWTLHATYCGVLEGEDRWRGQGPAVITTATGDTLTGRLVSAADLPTEGEPFAVEITGGTGAYEGAVGTCNFDNHLIQTGPGSQDQFGDWSCSITP